MTTKPAPQGNDLEIPGPWSLRSQRAMTVAARRAESRCRTCVLASDLLVGLIAEPDNSAAAMIRMAGFGTSDIIRQIDFLEGPSSSEAHPGKVEFSPRVLAILDHAEHEASSLDHSRVDTIHLLAGILKARAGLAILVLETPGIGLERVGGALARTLREGPRDPD